MSPYNLLIPLLVVLTTTQSPLQITLLDNTPVVMYQNGQTNTNFTQSTTTFNCSLSYMYTYKGNPNLPYNISVSNLSSTTTFSISSVYGSFNPTISPEICSTNCILTINNNCPSSTNYFNYFDRIKITVSSMSSPIEYYVICNDKYLSNTFQWGLLIEIVVCTIIIAIIAVFSKAWSLGGIGLTINIYLIILFNVLLIAGGVIGYFSAQVINIILIVLTFILGIIGVGICINQILFFLRIKFLNTLIFSLKAFDFRILELISLLAAGGICIGWYFSSANWIINDIVSMCIIIGFIKILKFTSLKIATIAFLATIILQLIFIIIIYFTTSNSYNNIFLNNFNYPLELQVPTINPVYNQKCSWLPFTSIIYPGMLLSYLRRFDSSRNTKVYLITSVGLFFLGAIVWMFISIASPFVFPTGLVSQPCMIILVMVFAYKRRQIRTLWDGKFYDEQFADRQGISNIVQLVAPQKRQSQLTIGKDIINDLMLNPYEQSRISDDSVIRSKFLRLHSSNSKQ